MKKRYRLIIIICMLTQKENYLAFYFFFFCNFAIFLNGMTHKII